MKRGEIWWASLPDPRDSEPGYRRPILIMQSDDFNQSAVRTVIGVAITSNLRRSEAPGNVLLPKRESSLLKDSVVDVTQLITVSRTHLVNRVGRIPSARIQEIENGLRLVLSL